MKPPLRRVLYISHPVQLIYVIVVVIVVVVIIIDRTLPISGVPRKQRDNHGEPFTCAPHHSCSLCTSEQNMSIILHLFLTVEARNEFRSA